MKTIHLQGQPFSRDTLPLSNVIHFICRLTDKSSYIRRIMLHTSDTVHVVDLDDVSFVMAIRGYCEIHTSNGKKYISAKTLAEYESLLAPVPGFVRVNKSYIINTRMIKGYSKGAGCCIYMKENGQEIEVSRRRKKEILDLLKLV